MPIPLSHDLLQLPPSVSQRAAETMLISAQFCDLPFNLVPSHFYFLRAVEMIFLSTSFLTTSLRFPMNKNKPS